jgi:hypothetical protein
MSSHHRRKRHGRPPIGCIDLIAGPVRPRSPQPWRLLHQHAVKHPHQHPQNSSTRCRCAPATLPPPSSTRPPPPRVVLPVQPLWSPTTQPHTPPLAVAHDAATSSMHTDNPNEELSQGIREWSGLKRNYFYTLSEFKKY